MTQQERINDGGTTSAAIYNNDRQATRTDTAEVRENSTVRPTDLVRWGAVIAGLFAALATLITLSILGIAIGLSSFDYGDPARSFGIGTGIWGAITALIAFLVGGWVAGRSSVFKGKTSGIMNGAMVWFVAIPLLLYLLGAGIGSLARTAGGVAGTAAAVAAPVAGQAAQDPSVQATAQAGAAGAAQAVQATAQAVQSQVTPENVNQAVDSAANGAWGALLALGLAAAASIFGGYLGTRPHAHVVPARARS